MGQANSNQKRIVVAGWPIEDRRKVLHSLKLGPVKKAKKNIERVEFKNVSFESFLQGKPDLKCAQAIIYLVNSEDLQRIKCDLHELCCDEALPREACILVLTTNDVSPVDKLINDLQLAKLPHVWNVESRLFDGLDWLSAALAPANNKAIALQADNCLTTPLALIFGPSLGPSLYRSMNIVARFGII